jgi:hypothetical protein
MRSVFCLKPGCDAITGRSKNLEICAELHQLEPTFLHRKGHLSESLNQSLTKLGGKAWKKLGKLGGKKLGKKLGKAWTSIEGEKLGHPLKA